MDYTVHGILHARILEWVAFPFPGDLPNAGIEPRSPTLQEDSLPAEPQGKPKNSELSSLSLLRRIFPTQESSRGLLHYRWILYQLSYQGTINFATVLLLLLSRFSGVQLCDPIDCIPPCSSIHGILQSRVLEWGAITFSLQLHS